MSKLTDEQIEAIYKQETGALIDDSPWALVDFSRAIEAAATEPLLQRIAHLEATASANYGRGHADAHSMLSERIAKLERQLEEARNQALEEAAVECDKRAHAGDAGALMAARAIRALKGAKE